MAQRTMMVGPYLLVRPLATKNLRIYQVHEPSGRAQALGYLWVVAAPEYGIPEEWRIRCADCPEPPSSGRAESLSRAFYDRDRALSWFRMHRQAKHPPLSTEVA